MGQGDNFRFFPHESLTPTTSEPSLITMKPADLNCLKCAPPRTTQRKILLRAAERPALAACGHDALARAVSKWRGFSRVARAHPLAVIVPLLVFIVAATVGCVGVWAGSRSARDQMVLLTRDAASSASRETGMQLQLWAAPAIAAVSVIREQPVVPILIRNLTDWIAPLVDSSTNSLDANASAFSLTLVPWGVITAVYPTAPEALATLRADLLGHSAFSSNAISFAAAPPGTSEVLGPMQNSMGTAFYNYFNLWLPSSNPNETWGMDGRLTFDWAPGVVLGNRSRQPWQGPCGGNCAPRPQADGSWLVFGGFVIVTVPATPIVNRLESMSTAAKKNVRFNYVLYRHGLSYTELSSQLSPMELVQLLDQLYSGFDDLVDKHGLYKVETIGDAFMCVGGAPDPCDPYDAARRVAQMALDMVKLTETFETGTGRKIQIRVGMHSGNVTAAVMGRKMPHWCLVGDAVNVSSRMESNSRPMQVHVGASTARLLGRFPQFDLKPRGAVDIKGKGLMSTYWLTAATAAGGVQVPQLQDDLLLAEVGVQLRSLSSCPTTSAL